MPVSSVRSECRCAYAAVRNELPIVVHSQQQNTKKHARCMQMGKLLFALASHFNQKTYREYFTHEWTATYGYFKVVEIAVRAFCVCVCAEASDCEVPGAMLFTGAGRTHDAKCARTRETHQDEAHSRPCAH